jgi:hypothetical protein
VEGIDLDPKQFSGDSYVLVDMVIIKRQGLSPKFMKVIPFLAGAKTVFQFGTSSSTVVGMSNTAFGASVGASFSANSPAFGVAS